MRPVAVFGVFILFTSFLQGSVSAGCPANSEYAYYGPCDYFCNTPCDYKGVSNVCICREGYLKDRQTMECVLEAQCHIPAEVKVLRSGEAPPFTFDCFT